MKAEKTPLEALKGLVCVIDLHLFQKGDKLEINPIFLPVLAEAVQDARDCLSNEEK